MHITYVLNEIRIMHAEEREGDLKGWSTVLVTVLGSWEKRFPAALRT
jgi:hypothetical protein